MGGEDGFGLSIGKPFVDAKLRLSGLGQAHNAATRIMRAHQRFYEALILKAA